MEVDRIHQQSNMPPRQRSQQRMTSHRDGEHGDHNGACGDQDHDVAGTVARRGYHHHHHHHVAEGGETTDGVMQKKQPHASGFFSDEPIDYDISEDQGATSAAAVE